MDHREIALLYPRMRDVGGCSANTRAMLRFMSEEGAVRFALHSGDVMSIDVVRALTWRQEQAIRDATPCARDIRVDVTRPSGETVRSKEFAADDVDAALRFMERHTPASNPAETLVRGNPAAHDPLNLYLNWASSMIIGRMSRADALLDKFEREIRGVARGYWRRVQPWGPDAGRTLWRGLRLAGENLDGTALITSAKYAAVKALSFTEDVDTACHFADPGSMGFPAIGEGRLPPNGYVAEADVSADRVLFHWRYFEADPRMWDFVFQASGGFDYRVVIPQREVTVFVPGLVQMLRGFSGACEPYVRRRYGPGGWAAGDPDPFGPSMFGENV